MISHDTPHRLITRPISPRSLPSSRGGRAERVCQNPSCALRTFPPPRQNFIVRADDGEEMASGTRRCDCPTQKRPQAVSTLEACKLLPGIRLLAGRRGCRGGRGVALPACDWSKLLHAARHSRADGANQPPKTARRLAVAKLPELLREQ
jgi:hypothetical protein